MKKNRFSIIFVKVFIVGLLLYNHNANAQTYNTNDSLRIANFLTQNSAITGYTNGEQINPAFVASNPTTWNGFSWTPDGTGQLRLETINITNKNLSGNLNLTDCQHIAYIYCNNNQIKAIITNEVNSIRVLNCANNAIEIMDLSTLSDIQELYCQNNDISYLDIHNANNLMHFNAEGNKLSFNQLKMPNNQATMDKSFWHIGLQKEFVPSNVSKIGSIFVCEGMLLNLADVNSNTENSVHFYKQLTHLPLIHNADYNVSNNNYAFADALANETIYLKITNTNTHHNLLMQSVPFKLDFIFDNNDVTRLRYFLEQKDNFAIKNGEKVNPLYDYNDPYTFLVEWKPIKNAANQSILRCRTIKQYQNKNLIGILDLQYMDKLTEVIIANNKISEMLFADNTSLFYIDAAGNRIETLNLDEIPNLSVLIADDNEITEIDFSNCNVLMFASLNDNKILGIDITSNTYLRELYLSDNILKHFYIPTNSRLERLYLDNNFIDEIDIPNVDFLEVFSINDNFLTKLDLTKAKNITNVECANNYINLLNLTGLNKINKLICSDNELTFNGIQLPNVLFNTINAVLHPQDTIAREKFMYVNGKYYNTENVLDLSEYIYHDVPSGITYFDIYFVDNFGHKTFFETNITGIVEITDYLEGRNIIVEVRCENLFPNLVLTTPLFIGYNQYAENDVFQLIKFLDLYSKYGNESNGQTNGIILNPSYHKMLPSTYPVTWQKVGGIYRLTEINWFNEPLLKGDLDLSDCDHLVSLNISCLNNLNRNDITSLDLTNCTSLTEVHCSYSQLGSLAIDNCPVLVHLDGEHNKIENAITLTSPLVKKVYLNTNKIPSINIVYKTNLTHFTISDNNLTELNINNASNLVELDCSNNKIASFSFNNVTKLNYLDISNNKLTGLDLSSNKYLKELYCSNNNLSSLLLQNCIELAALECSNNNLSSLDLSDIEYLYHLHCENNSLTFATLQYPTIPNVIKLHPQTILRPSCIDVQHILSCDSLPLGQYFGDATGNVVLRYHSDNSLVPSGYYSVKGYVVTFTDYLIDTSIYCELTHSHYPGLVLSTIHFNIAAPMQYNANEVSSLKHFLEQESKDAGKKNGTYLSENYNVNDPASYPSVEWVASGSEFRVFRIKWNERPKLKGNADFSNFYLMDTLQLNGTETEKTEVYTINTDYCYDLKELDLRYNQLESVTISRSTKLQVLNISNNKLKSLDIRGLNNLSLLDVRHNKLVFNTFSLSHRPYELYWYPQDSVKLSKLLPLSVDNINCKYQIKREDSTLKLEEEFGHNVRWDFQVLDNAGNIYAEVSMSSGNKEYTIPPSWDEKYIVIKLVGADQYKEDLVLDVVRFWANLEVGISSRIESFSVYPNPLSDYVYLNVGSAILTSILLLDASGERVKQFEVTTEPISLDVRNVSSGVYFLLLTTKDGYQVLPLTIVR